MRHSIETRAQIRGAHRRLWGEELEREVRGARGQGRDLGGNFLHCEEGCGFNGELGSADLQEGFERGCCRCGGEEKESAQGWMFGGACVGSLGELRSLLRVGSKRGPFIDEVATQMR